MGKSENINQSYTLYLIFSTFDPKLYALCSMPRALCFKSSTIYIVTPKFSSIRFSSISPISSIYLSSIHHSSQPATERMTNEEWRISIDSAAPFLFTSFRIPHSEFRNQSPLSPVFCLLSSVLCPLCPMLYAPFTRNSQPVTRNAKHVTCPLSSIFRIPTSDFCSLFYSLPLSCMIRI
jgi:hypothetical protein